MIVALSDPEQQVNMPRYLAYKVHSAPILL